MIFDSLYFGPKAQADQINTKIDTHFWKYHRLNLIHLRLCTIFNWTKGARPGFSALILDANASAHSIRFQSSYNGGDVFTGMCSLEECQLISATV